MKQYDIYEGNGFVATQGGFINALHVARARSRFHPLCQVEVVDHETGEVLQTYCAGEPVD